MKKDFFGRLKRYLIKYKKDMKVLKSLPQCHLFYKWKLKYPRPSIKRYSLFTDFLIKKYGDKLIDTEANIPLIEKDCKVYTFWFQNLENAPAIVKKCIAINAEILKKQNIEFVILDKDNMSKYIELPNEILSLVDEGYIDLLQLSVFVRLKVLLEYGGLWIDSTVLLNDVFSINDIINRKTVSLNLNDKNFTYSNNGLTVVNPFVSSFLAFGKQHSGWKIIYNIFVDYYLEYKKEFNYYIIDNIVTAFLIKNPNSDIFENKIQQDSFFELFYTYNTNKTYTLPQKLSYKISKKQQSKLENALITIEEKYLVNK